MYYPLMNHRILVLVHIPWRAINIITVSGFNDTLTRMFLHVLPKEGEMMWWLKKLFNECEFINHALFEDHHHTIHCRVSETVMTRLMAERNVLRRIAHRSEGWLIKAFRGWQTPFRKQALWPDPELYRRCSCRRVVVVEGGKRRKEAIDGGVS